MYEIIFHLLDLASLQSFVLFCFVFCLFVCLFFLRSSDTLQNSVHLFQ